MNAYIESLKRIDGEWIAVVARYRRIPTYPYPWPLGWVRGDDRLDLHHTTYNGGEHGIVWREVMTGRHCLVDDVDLESAVWKAERDVTPVPLTTDTEGSGGHSSTGDQQTRPTRALP